MSACFCYGSCKGGATSVLGVREEAEQSQEQRRGEENSQKSSPKATRRWVFEQSQINLS
jgi:hypothetical protein